MDEIPDEKDFIPKPDRLDESGWEQYFQTLLDFAEDGRECEDFGSYTPSPKEIRRRIGMMRWLEALGFDDRFVCSVMYYGSPSIEMVRKFVKKYGIAETKRRLGPMVE